MSNENKRKDGWFIRHVLSALSFNFDYESRDFWWGNDDIFDKSRAVYFRFIKLWSANFLAWFSKYTLFFIGALFFWLVGVIRDDGLQYGAGLLLTCLLLSSVFFSLQEYFNIMSKK